MALPTISQPRAWRGVDALPRTRSHPSIWSVRAVIAALLCSTLTAGVSLSVLWPAMAPTSMLVFAHRGDVDRWPEDTLQAVTAAAAGGADGIEFDVHRSSDGSWWLLHDETLDQDTSGHGRPEEQSDAALAALVIDGGHGYVSGIHHDIHLARLVDVLDALDEYHGYLMIDLKSMATADHAEIARLIQERGLSDRAFVICRTIDGATAVKVVDSHIQTVMLNGFTWHPDVDVELTDATAKVGWPYAAWGDAFGTFGMFVEADSGPANEIPILENGRRWGVALVVTNHLSMAMAWQARQ